MTDREQKHPEDLPWNDAGADDDVPAGSHDPAPGEVVDDERDLSTSNFPDDPYRRDTLDERLAEELPDRAARDQGGAIDLVDQGNRDDLAELDEPDVDDALHSPAEPAEDAAIHIIGEDQL